MYLYGKRAVQERLKVNPGSIKKIYLSQGKFIDLSEKARQKKIPLFRLENHRFPGLRRDAVTQGLIAEVEEFQYADFYNQIKQPDEKKPVLLFLDRITDPRNLGALMRSCACFGGFCLVLPRYHSAEINETVLKVACGAENYVPVVAVVNLAQALREARKEGYWIAASVVEGGETPEEAKLNFPLGIIIGNEEEGIRPGLLKMVDFKITLAMPGTRLSFNVAVATSLLCYEIIRKK